MLPLILLFASAIRPLNSAPLDSFMANDRCSMLLSGSSASQRSVRSVFLDCEQGSLLWERPTGSLLATFSAPASLLGAGQLCLRFPEPPPEKATLQRMAQSQLQSAVRISSRSLHCFPFQSSERQVQLFVRTNRQTVDDNRFVGFYYAFEAKPREEDAQAQCGQCSRKQFLDAFCSANYVFRGKLLQNGPEGGNGLVFSAEWPIQRRPLLLTHVLSEAKGAEAQFNTTTLFSACASSALRPSFHSRLVVVANAQLGFARLLCQMEHSQFEQIPVQSAPCDIRLRER